MRKLLVFLTGMVGLCGAMNTPPDYRNFIGLGLFGLAVGIGARWGR